MYKIGTQVDYKEAASIEMRRKREEDRKNRIFNAKERQIGIDTKSLGMQVKQKQQLADVEKRREEAFAADAIKNDKITQLLYQRTEEDRRTLNYATNEFRLQHQTPNCRREFELNDPDMLKKDLPARTSDLDPRCGPASIQRFDGEDLYYEERKKQQNNQLKNWMEQQVRERRSAEDNQRMADQLYDSKMIQLDQRAMELQRAEDECRRSINEANKQYNKALLKEQQLKETYKWRQDEEDKRAEIANNLYGDFLTENPDASISAFGYHRVMPNRWKGMTQAQVAEIRKEQEQQKIQAQRRRCEEASLKEQEDREQVAQTKNVILMERELERRKKELARQNADENMRLASMQKRHQEHLNHNLTSNEPTSAYFEQFNTCTR